MSLSNGTACLSNSGCKSKNCHQSKCADPELYQPCSVSLQNCPKGQECHKESEHCLPVGEGLNPTNCKNSAYCAYDKFCGRNRKMCFLRGDKDEGCSGWGTCKDGLVCAGGTCYPRCITDTNCPDRGKCIGEFSGMNYCIDISTPTRGNITVEIGNPADIIARELIVVFGALAFIIVAVVVAISVCRKCRR